MVDIEDLADSVLVPENLAPNNEMDIKAILTQEFKSTFLMFQVLWVVMKIRIP